MEKGTLLQIREHKDEVFMINCFSKGKRGPLIHVWPGLYSRFIVLLNGKRLAVTTTHFARTKKNVFLTEKWLSWSTFEYLFAIFDHLSVRELARNDSCQLLRRYD